LIRGIWCMVKGVWCMLCSVGSIWVYVEVSIRRSVYSVGSMYVFVDVQYIL